MSPDGNNNVTRRTALKSGAATAGLLTVGSLSGCSSIPFIGGAGYTEWLTDPDEYSDSESLSFGFSKPNVVAENEDNFDSDYIDGYEENNSYDSLDVDYENVTYDLTGGLVSVVDGDYEESTVVDALEDADTGAEYEEEGEYEGYTVYLPANQDEPTSAVGVNGTQVVSAGATQDDDAEAGLEMAVDTKNGDVARLTDESDSFSTLTDELGDGTFVGGSLREEAVEEGSPEAGRFEGEIASGQKITINGETSDYKSVVVWDSEGDTDEGGLEDYADESLDDAYSPNDDPSFGVSGRVGTIEFSFDTDEF